MPKDSLEIDSAPGTDVETPADGGGTPEQRFIDYMARCAAAMRQLEKDFEVFRQANPMLFDPDFLREAVRLPREERIQRLLPFAVFQHQIIDTLRILSVDGWTTEYTNLLEQQLGINEAHFSHNIGKESAQCFISHMNTLLFRPCSDATITDFTEAAHNFGYFSEQTACHFESFANRVRELTGTYETGNCADVRRAIRVALGSRAFFNPVQVHEPDRPARTDLPQATMAFERPSMQIPGLSTGELVSVLYAPVSNSTRFMRNALEDGRAAAELVLESVFRETEFEGSRFVTAEIFNSGSLVDISAICKQMSMLDERKLKQVSPEAHAVIQAVRAGSRQADLSLADPMAVLFVEGVSTRKKSTEASGLGLFDMKRHVDLRGGAVMINNVFSEDPKKEGVCVTILFPLESGFTHVNPNRLRELLERLKSLMQSGAYVLPRIEEKAA